MRISWGGMKGFAVENRLDRSERACLSGPDRTVTRGAVVRAGAGFQGTLDFLSKGRPVSVNEQTEDT